MLEYMFSKILLVGMLVGSAFDIGTTEYALGQGLHEANPLLRNRGVRITVNIAVPIALYKLTKDKTKKTQLAVAGIYIGSKAFVSLHNYKLARRTGGGEQNLPTVVDSRWGS